MKLILPLAKTLNKGAGRGSRERGHMMKSSFASRHGIAMAAVCAAVVLPWAALAECPSIPDVEWWKGANHEKTIAYVEKKHQGDWQPYIDKWDRQKNKLNKIKERGTSVVIKSRGLRLEGRDLVEYVDKVSQRVEAIRCLAEAEGFANFSTAAG